MKLLIEDDQGNRSVVPVVRDEITIGRKEDNAIRLTERNVSRHHAKLVRGDGGVYVEDVEARYGIKKNGQDIDDRAEFSEGDVVLIGDYRLTLRPEKAAGTGPSDVNGAAAEVSPELQEDEAKLEETSGADLQESSQAESAGSAHAEASDPELDAALDTEGAAATSETQIIQTEPASLVVISSNFAGQEFPLDREEMVIGRDEECDIIIDHRSVSGKHAKVVREGTDTYKINDLNSSNGVKVDGEEYKSVHLERGDIIELGHVKFRFVEPGENYVFSPQSSDEIEAAETSATTKDSSTGVMVMVGGAAVAVLAIGGLALALIGGSGNGDENPQANTTSPKTKPGGGEGGESGDKVDKKIAQAERDIKKGEVDSAIASLKSVKDLLDPTAEQSRQINDLLTDARQEKPFAEHYEKAKVALDNENYEDVVEQIDREIPEHSVFHKLVVENGFRQEALDGMLEQAKGELEAGDEEDATRLAQKLKRYESHREEAERILEESDVEPTEVASAKNVGDEAGGGSPGRGTASSPGGTGSPTPDPDETDSSGSSSDPGGGVASTSGGGTGGSESPDPGASEPESSGGDSTGGGATGGGTTGGGTTGGDTAGGGTTGGGGGSVSASEAKNYKQTAMKKWIQGDNAAAISNCKKALQGGMTDCYRIIGMSHKREGNKPEACRYLSKYIGTSPSDASKIRGVMDDLGCD